MARTPYSISAMARIPVGAACHAAPRRIVAGLVAALCCAALALGGCGGEEGPRDPGVAPAPGAMPPLSPAEPARYALARLLTGPVPHPELPLPLSHHDHSLKLAKLDLVTLSSETETLLEDPALLERITGDAPDTSG